MADEPNPDDDKVVSNDAFKKAQWRREQQERRKRAHEKKLGPGDETRQFGCEMRPNDKNPGLHGTSEDGGWRAQVFKVAGIGRSPGDKDGVPVTRGIVIEFKNRDGHERTIFISDGLLKRRRAALGSGSLRSIRSVARLCLPTIRRLRFSSIVLQIYDAASLSIFGWGAGYEIEAEVLYLQRVRRGLGAGCLCVPATV